MMETKNLKFVFIVLISSSILLAILISSNQVSAQFNTTAEICTPLWYCSNYTSGTCGLRVCFDANYCGNNYNRPTEYIACPSAPPVSSGGGGGGGSTSLSADDAVTADKGFDLSTDILKVELGSTLNISRLLKISSHVDTTYKIKVFYPETLSSENQVIYYEDDSFYAKKNEVEAINFLFSPNNLDRGTHVFSIEISNKYFSKNVTVIVNKNSDGNLLDFLIELPSTNKLIRDKSTLTPKITLSGWLAEQSKVTYSIITPTGSITYLDTQIINTSNQKHFVAEIEIPNNLAPGYYVLNVAVESGDGYRSKYEVFTVLPETTFYEVKETPSNIPQTSGGLTELLFFVILIFVFAVFFIAIKMSGFSRDKNLKRKEIPNNDKKAEDENVPETKVTILDKKDIIKKAYAQGFITKEEHDSFIGISSDSKQTTDVSTKEEQESKSENKFDFSHHINKIKDRFKKKKPEETSKSPLLSNDKKSSEEQSADSQKTFSQSTKSNKSKDTEQKNTKSEKKKTTEQQSAVSQKADNSSPDRRVSEEEAFVLVDGRKLYSLADLYNTLDFMSTETFDHHTKNGRHDFSNWIKGVFKDEQLALSASDAKSIDDLKEVLEAIKS